MLITYGSCSIQNNTTCSFEGIVNSESDKGDWTCPDCGAKYETPVECKDEENDFEIRVVS